MKTSILRTSSIFLIDTLSWLIIFLKIKTENQTFLQIILWKRI